MTDPVEPYLWDRSGEADRDIERLESLMSELRYQPQPLAWDSVVARPRRRRTGCQRFADCQRRRQQPMVHRPPS